MKSLSLKLDDKVFDDTEAITKAMKVARNRYINDALELYNKFNQRLLLEKQIKKEVEACRESSMEVMRDWEETDNEFDAKFNQQIIIEKIQQYDIWLADLNPARGPIPGKIRPVVIVQSNLYNNITDTTVVCPITTNIVEGINYLRVSLLKEQLDKKSAILLDQIRTVENRKLIKKISRLNYDQIKKMKRNLQIILDL